MLLIGFRGAQASLESPIINDIAAGRVGGVVLLDLDIESGQRGRNITNPTQLKRLTDDLQASAQIPLFIAVTQEGGRVERLHPGNGFVSSPSAEVLGHQSIDETSKASTLIGKQLRASGINLNFAPVVDLQTPQKNPVIGGLQRSFGSDAQLVGQHAKAFIKGHHQQGVLTALKHFPGHGSSTSDSHLGFVDVTPSWRPIELEPYRQLIGEGLVDIIMTAHIFNSQLDPKFPATLSEAILNKLLRKSMGFDGVISTDDLQMGAIANKYARHEAVDLAIQAGADILLFSNNLRYDPHLALDVQRHILQQVHSGRIKEARIDASYQRILALKKKLRAKTPR
ncbi:MAG: glycoside hydrolase family 3 protein [Myxococcota bacterium]